MLWGLFWTFLRVDVNKHESSHIMFLGINECGKIPPVQQFAHLGWRSLVYCNFSVEFSGLQSFEFLFNWLKKYWNMSFYIEIVLLLSWNDSIAFISKVETVASIGVMHLCSFHARLFNATRKTWASSNVVVYVRGSVTELYIVVFICISFNYQG